MGPRAPARAGARATPRSGSRERGGAREISSVRRLAPTCSSTTRAGPARSSGARRARSAAARARAARDPSRARRPSPRPSGARPPRAARSPRARAGARRRAADDVEAGGLRARVPEHRVEHHHVEAPLRERGERRGVLRRAHLDARARRGRRARGAPRRPTRRARGTPRGRRRARAGPTATAATSASAPSPSVQSRTGRPRAIPAASRKDPGGPPAAPAATPLRAERAHPRRPAPLLPVRHERGVPRRRARGARPPRRPARAASSERWPRAAKGEPVPRRGGAGGGLLGGRGAEGRGDGELHRRGRRLRAGTQELYKTSSMVTRKTNGRAAKVRSFSATDEDVAMLEAVAAVPRVLQVRDARRPRPPRVLAPLPRRHGRHQARARRPGESMTLPLVPMHDPVASPDAGSDLAARATSATGGGDPRAREGEGRGHPRAQLPDARGPEDRRPRRRLAAARDHRQEGPQSTIVFCGVHFMAESAKVLAPDEARAPAEPLRRLLARGLDHRPSRSRTGRSATRTTPSSPT